MEIIPYLWRMIPVDLPVMEIAGAVNEALAVSPRLVVTAPPGAGKSTVLPLTILEEIRRSGSANDGKYNPVNDGKYNPANDGKSESADSGERKAGIAGKIIILEPRRIAARGADRGHPDADAGRRPGPGERGRRDF